MKKILLGLFLATSLLTNAQNLSVKNWELELKFGGTLPLSSNNTTTAQLGPAMGAEVRYNLEDSPFSLGAKNRFDRGTQGHQWEKHSNHAEPVRRDKGNGLQNH